MQYEEALKAWGCGKLQSLHQGRTVDTDSVRVTFEFDRGYQCGCGGREDCYCSYDEAPRASVTIQAGSGHNYMVYSVDPEDFDFAAVLGEIVDAGDGALTK